MVIYVDSVIVPEYWSDSHMYIILTLQRNQWVEDHIVMFNYLEVNSLIGLLKWII